MKHWEEIRGHNSTPLGDGDAAFVEPSIHADASGSCEPCSLDTVSLQQPECHPGVPAPTSLLQRMNPVDGTRKAPAPFDAIKELAAFAIEDTDQAGADRLYKIITHPEADLQAVKGSFKNKGQWLQYLDKQAAHRVSAAALDGSALIVIVAAWLTFS